MLLARDHFRMHDGRADGRKDGQPDGAERNGGRGAGAAAEESYASFAKHELIRRRRQRPRDGDPKGEESEEVADQARRRRRGIPFPSLPGHLR